MGKKDTFKLFPYTTDLQLACKLKINAHSLCAELFTPYAHVIHSSLIFIKEDQWTFFFFYGHEAYIKIFIIIYLFQIV